MTALVDNVVKLLPSGLEVETSVMLDKMGLPDPQGGGKVLSARGPGKEEAPDGGESGADTEEKPGEKPKEKRERTAAKASASSQGYLQDDPADPMDEWTAELLGDWQPLAAPLVDPVVALAESCADEREFLDRLPELASGSDAAALAERLARALFAVKLAGMAGEDL